MENSLWLSPLFMFMILFIFVLFLTSLVSYNFLYCLSDSLYLSLFLTVFIFLIQITVNNEILYFTYTEKRWRGIIFKVNLKSLLPSFFYYFVFDLQVLSWMYFHPLVGLPRSFIRNCTRNVSTIVLFYSNQPCTEGSFPLPKTIYFLFFALISLVFLYFACFFWFDEYTSLPLQEKVLYVLME